MRPGKVQRSHPLLQLLHFDRVFDAHLLKQHRDRPLLTTRLLGHKVNQVAVRPKRQVHNRVERQRQDPSEKRFELLLQRVPNKQKGRPELNRRPEHHQQQLQPQHKQQPKKTAPLRHLPVQLFGRGDRARVGRRPLQPAHILGVCVHAHRLLALVRPRQLQHKRPSALLPPATPPLPLQTVRARLGPSRPIRHDLLLQDRLAARALLAPERTQAHSHAPQLFRLQHKRRESKAARPTSLLSALPQLLSSIRTQPAHFDPHFRAILGSAAQAAAAQTQKRRQK